MHHCYIGLQRHRIPPCHKCANMCFFGAICGSGPITSLTPRSTGPYTACRHLGKHFMLAQIPPRCSGPVSSNVKSALSATDLERSEGPQCACSGHLNFPIVRPQLANCSLSASSLKGVGYRTRFFNGTMVLAFAQHSAHKALRLGHGTAHVTIAKIPSKSHFRQQ